MRQAKLIPPDQITSKTLLAKDYLMPDQPRATVRNIDGQLVLEDPDALGVARAIAKHHCRALLEADADRIAHFRRRAQVLGHHAGDVVIVLLNVDDPVGGALAEKLVPNHNWQAYRDLGQIPVARGLAGREGIQDALDFFDHNAGDTLRLVATARIAVIVVDYGVAEVF